MRGLQPPGRIGVVNSGADMPPSQRGDVIPEAGMPPFASKGRIVFVLRPFDLSLSRAWPPPGPIDWPPPSPMDCPPPGPIDKPPPSKIDIPPPGPMDCPPPGPMESHPPGPMELGMQLRHAWALAFGNHAAIISAVARNGRNPLRSMEFSFEPDNGDVAVFTMFHCLGRDDMPSVFTSTVT